MALATNYKANVSQSSTAYELVPAIPGKCIRVLGFIAMAGATATNVTFNSNSTAISATFACGINGGVAPPETANGWFCTAKGEALTVTTGSGSTVGIQLIVMEVTA